MNHEENIIGWNVGDLVIHDTDEKSALYLMRVTEIDRTDRLIKTVYHNRKGFKPFYLNRKEVLHDPFRFEIEV